MVERKPLPRGTLSLAAIVDATLKVIDARGLEACTMRRVAAVLGCEAMSLYKHVANKSQLLLACADAVMADIPVPSTELPWQDRLRALAEELRRVALAHPNLFPYLALQLPVSPATLAPIDSALTALVDSGLDDERAVKAFWAFIAYVTGALMAEAAAVSGADQPMPGLLGHADLSDAPTVARLSHLLSGSDYGDEFTHGVNLFLASVEQSVVHER